MTLNDHIKVRVLSALLLTNQCLLSLVKAGPVSQALVKKRLALLVISADI